MWLNIVESGQFLNSEMVERFSVDQGEDTFILNAHMPSGETVAVPATRPSAKAPKLSEN